jgi:hypothetical protein
MLEAAHNLALNTILKKLEGLSEPWVVTGSCSMALQGMPLEVHDIDLQTTRKGAFDIEQALGGRILLPLAYKPSERICSYFGALEVEGVKVEIMGDMQKLLPDGTWEEPADIPSHRIWIPFEDRRAPVFPLEYERQAYRLMGRPHRAAQIEEWLKQPPDK